MQCIWYWWPCATMQEWQMWLYNCEIFPSVSGSGETVAPQSYPITWLNSNGEKWVLELLELAVTSKGQGAGLRGVTGRRLRSFVSASVPLGNLKWIDLESVFSGPETPVCDLTERDGTVGKKCHILWTLPSRTTHQLQRSRFGRLLRPRQSLRGQSVSVFSCWAWVHTKAAVWAA